MAIKTEDVRKIAKLAHLRVSDEEVMMYTPQMADIVAYVEQLNELDTENTEPAIGGFTTEGMLTKTTRQDIAGESIGQEKALEQSPSASHGHFRVPKVL